MRELIEKQAAIDAHCELCGDRNKCNSDICPDVEVFQLIPTIQPESQWISCSERLPEEPGLYLVSGGSKTWFCEFCKLFEVGGWINSVRNPEVKAWMPLPEPYREEGE